MKTLLKGLGIIIAFVVLYVVIMLFAYQYLYPYPVGYLDNFERDNGMLQYKLVNKYAITDETTLYFTRESNGTGKKVHVGTLWCKYPKIVRNFYSETTSWTVIPANAYGYATTTDGINYLFGHTGDMNTVKVVITFHKPDNTDVELEMKYDGLEEETFYYVNFDTDLLNYPSTIEGLNEEDGICFSYSGPAFNTLE
ncbi:MAG: hypothetical protein II126_03855, partial [Erysipelotrichaceae bacterium]|nr:hypothetical protein [Erysipelotrichaceae bacterium]